MITIYKKDTAGKIRYIKAWTTGAYLYQESGVLGTDKPVTHEKICKAKNVDRSNETSPGIQAISEMESLIAEKLKGEYFKTQAEAEAGGDTALLPMLAKSYKDESKKVDWNNAFTQPKLDGMRCLIRKASSSKVTLTSREGTVIDTVPHVVADFLQNAPYGLYDGELYAHGQTFQENMRLIKKYREGESEAIKFHCYDILESEGRLIAGLAFRTRRGFIPGNLETLVVVPTTQVYNENELKVAHTKNLGEGFEGTILRWGDAPYKPNGRSSNLLKYKDFIDIALPILDVVPCEDRPEWGKFLYFWEGASYLKNGDDTLGSGMKFSHDERKEFLKNKDQYIGKIAEVRFFEYSEKGVPRFPVSVGLRLDKTKPDKT